MARTEAGLPAGIRVTDHISLAVLTASLPLEVAHAVLRASERERALAARCCHRSLVMRISSEGDHPFRSNPITRFG